MQVPKFVYGSIAPTFTAFNQDGSLDDAGQRNLVDFMLEFKAIDAFFIRSGMGQMYTFEVDDVKQLAKNLCAHMAGKAPVLVGCSGVWDRNYERRPDPAVYVQQAIELGKFAEGAGADGVVYTIPEGLVPAEGEPMDDFLVKYFTTVCGAVSCPVFFYQPPGTRQEYCVTPETLARLADIDNLVGGKVSTNDGYYLFRLIRAVRDKEFGFICGAETAFYAGLMAGARACIGQGTTVNPQVIRAVVDRFVAGDFDGAVQAQEDTNLLVEKCPNAVDFFKRYATEKGFPVGPYARSLASNPYVQNRSVLADEDYQAYKKIYEGIVARYA
jgi:4-hydroxy-tetrahydrodipicolinate synthase